MSTLGLSDFELVPQGYVENNVGGEVRKEPVLRLRSTGGKASSGKYDSDLLPVFAILFSAAGLFIVTYLFVHYTAKGIEAGIRKAKQYAAERRAREAAVRAAEAETARIAAIPESVRNIERVAAGLRSVRTERPKRHAIR